MNIVLTFYQIKLSRLFLLFPLLLLFNACGGGGSGDDGLLGPRNRAPQAPVEVDDEDFALLKQSGVWRVSYYLEDDSSYTGQFDGETEVRTWDTLINAEDIVSVTRTSSSSIDLRFCDAEQPTHLVTDDLSIIDFFNLGEDNTFLNQGCEEGHTIRYFNIGDSELKVNFSCEGASSYSSDVLFKKLSDSPVFQQGTVNYSLAPGSAMNTANTDVCGTYFNGDVLNEITSNDVLQVSTHFLYGNLHIRFPHDNSFIYIDTYFQESQLKEGSFITSMGTKENAVIMGVASPAFNPSGSGYAYYEYAASGELNITGFSEYSVSGNLDILTEAGREIRADFTFNLE